MKHPGAFATLYRRFNFFHPLFYAISPFVPLFFSPPRSLPLSVISLRSVVWLLGLLRTGVLVILAKGVECDGEYTVREVSIAYCANSSRIFRRNFEFPCLRAAARISLLSFYYFTKVSRGSISVRRNRGLVLRYSRKRDSAVVIYAVALQVAAAYIGYGRVTAKKNVRMKIIKAYRSWSLEFSKFSQVVLIRHLIRLKLQIRLSNSSL